MSPYSIQCECRKTLSPTILLGTNQLISCTLSKKMLHGVTRRKNHGDSQRKKLIWKNSVYLCETSVHLRVPFWFWLVQVRDIKISDEWQVMSENFLSLITPHSSGVTYHARLNIDFLSVNPLSSKRSQISIYSMRLDNLASVPIILLSIG